MHKLAYNSLRIQLAAKLESLRSEYIRFAVEKCSSVLREYHSAVETITGMRTPFISCSNVDLKLSFFAFFAFYIFLL